MRFNVLIGCALLVIVTGAYSRQGAADSPNQAGSSLSNTAEISPPMPNALDSGWWDYFNDADKSLLDRINQAKQQYATLLTTLEKPQQEAARQIIDRFTGNLLVLNRLRESAKTRPVIEPIKVKDSYSIQEWLDIDDQLRRENAEFIDNQSHIETQENALDAAANQLSDLQLQYLRAASESGEKIVLGLKIMADRSAMEVNRARLLLNKNSLVYQRKLLDMLGQSSRIAARRLRTEPQFSEHLDSLISGLKKQLTQNQEALQKALADSMAIVEDNASSLSQARMRDQEVVKLMIQGDTLKLKIASKQAEKDLSALLSASKGLDFSDIQYHLRQWQNLIESTQSNALIWHKDSSLELTRIQDKIISQSQPDSVSTKLDNTLSQRLELAQTSLVELRQLDIERNRLNLLSQQVDKYLDQRTGKLAHFLNWSTSQAEDFLSGLSSWAAKPLFSIGQTPVTVAGLLRALIIFAVAGFISFLIRQGINKLAERIEANDKGVSVFYTVGRLLHYVILFLGFIIALTSIGLDFTNLALVAGALSVGIGFGLQSIVNNFVSGLILLFEGTIKIGDFIDLDDNVQGTVREINVRNTQVNTPDNVDIIIPNSVLVSGKVTNWTLREANRRIHVPFGVAYGTDKELVKKAALEAASRVRYTYKPRYTDAAQCWLVKFGDSSLDFELVVWINREAVKKPPMVYAAYLWEIESSLHEHGIEIPFPQRDLHLRTGFREKQDQQELSPLQEP